MLSVQISHVPAELWLIQGHDFNTGFRPPDAMWRKHRKFLKPALSQDTVKRDYSDLFIRKSRAYLSSLLEKPEDFLHTLTWYDLPL